MFTGVCLFFLSPCFISAAPVAESHALFEAVYDAKIKIAGGKVRLATTRDEDGGYTFEYSVEPGKLIRLFTSGELREITKFEVVDGRPRTLDYTLINTIGSRPRNAHVVFDWDENTVRGNYKDRTIDIPMPENAVDRALLQIVLMTDLKNNDLRPQYAVYNKDEFIRVNVERIGEETVRTPLGTFPTVKLRHVNEDGSSETLLWCAEEFGYLPVRIQANDDGSKVLVANLSAINGSPAD